MVAEGGAEGEVGGALEVGADGEVAVGPQPFEEAPEVVLRAALEAGRSALGRVSPGAPAAAVLHRGDKVLLAAAASAGRGALPELEAALGSVSGADFAAPLEALGADEGLELFLLLEPEPAEAAVLARLPRIVTARVALRDPGLSGAGVNALQDGGLDVREGSGASAAARLLEAYLLATRLARPHVLLKAATTLDGRIATRSGQSQWITGEAARARGRQLRGDVDAIVVGVGTVLADDPALTTRLPGRPDPLRVVLDSRARTPASAVVVATASACPTLIATTAAAPGDARRTLEAAGARVEVLPADPGGAVSVQALLARLFALGARSVLVEGGARVAGAFVDAGCVDRLAWFVAPMVFGGVDAPAAVAGYGAGPIGEALVLDDIEVERIGRDLLVSGRARALGGRRA